MHYGTTACERNGGRGPRIHVRQHMLHVNGEIHLASALIPGHNLMGHIQKSHSSARTEHELSLLYPEDGGITLLRNIHT